MASGATPLKTETDKAFFSLLPPSAQSNALAVLNASGELRLADFSREDAVDRMVKTLIPTPPNSVAALADAFRVKAAANAVFPKQLMPLVAILKNTLPALARDLPCWFLWAYEVEQRFQKYAPQLAGIWMEKGVLIGAKVAVECEQGSPSELSYVSFSPLYDAVDGKKRAQAFKEQIRLSIELLRQRHPSEKSSDFLGLITLLANASVALSCNLCVPFDPQKEPEKKVLYANLLSLVGFLDALDSHKNHYANFFPPYADVPSLQDKQQILEALLALRVRARENFIDCGKRIHGQNQAMIKGGNAQRNIVISRALASDGVAFICFKMKCFLLIPLQNAVYAWMEHFWPTEQRKPWESLRTAIMVITTKAALQPDKAKPLALHDLPFTKKQFHQLTALHRGVLDGLHCRIVLDDLGKHLTQWASSPIFKELMPEFMTYAFREAVLNLGFHLQNLHQQRKELLSSLQTLLKKQPKETLNANREKIIEAIRHSHQQSCLPIFTTYQLLFLLHRYNQFGEQSDESYVLSESALVGENQESEVFRPLSDYLHLTGLEKVFDRVLEEVVPLPHVEPKEAAFATLNAAVSQQYPKPQPEQIPPPPPVAKEDSKAPPKQPLVAKKQSATAEAAKTQTAAAKSDSQKTPELDVLSLRTSLTDRRKLVAFLNSMGIVLTEGGNHTTATGLPPVPRHKTFSDGVRHKIIKELAEKALDDGKKP